jgi:hypothetical protein
MSGEPQFQLQWRGESLGPWTHAEIQEQLRHGRIHSLYQIRVDGAWLPLREHLEKFEAAELQQRAVEMAARIRKREAEGQGRGMRPLGGPVKRPDPFANPPPVFVKGASSFMPPMFSGTETSPTCWLAVVAFVVSCCSFVPYLNLVSWLPSLVSGHLALAQLRRDPELDGRGLAVGALMISYAMLAFAAVTYLFFPNLFYRVFPIAG